jgi:hypothetical protein
MDKEDTIKTDKLDISGNKLDISCNDIVCDLQKDALGNYIDINGNIVKFYVILY